MSQNLFVYKQLNCFKYCYLTWIILFNIICLHTNSFKCFKWLNIFILPRYWTLTGPTPPVQSEPGRNDNERVLYIPQSSRTGASLSDRLVSYSGRLLFRSYLLLANSTSPADWSTRTQRHNALGTPSTTPSQQVTLLHW